MCIGSNDDKGKQPPTLQRPPGAGAWGGDYERDEDPDAYLESSLRIEDNLRDELGDDTYNKLSKAEWN